MLLANTLRELRLKQKLTKTSVAAHLGVSRPVIHQFESGLLVPSSERLAQLAVIFGVDAEFLNLLAGRIPADVLQALQHNPSLLSRLR